MVVRRDVLLGPLLALVPMMPGWGVSSEAVEPVAAETWFRSYRIDPEREDGLAWTLGDVRQFLASSRSRLVAVRGHFMDRPVEGPDSMALWSGPPDFALGAEVLSSEASLYAAYARGGQRWTFLRFELAAQ